jgi:myo-inositol-1(or 4)-monophosphatase
VVVDQCSGRRYEAARGGGAFCDGRRLEPSGCTRVGDAILALNGYPPRYLGWKQFRVLGAAALDLAAVAAGILDGYIDCTSAGISPWDYLGGALLCQEAGACVAAVDGADLVCRTGADRRVIVAAATPSLLQELLTLRQSFA